MTATTVTGRSDAAGHQEAARDRGADHSLARLVTDVLEPRNLMIALVILLGWHAGGLAGVGWGLVIGLFAVLLPVLFVRYGIRHWQWTSRHVSGKGERLAALAFVVASDAAGTATMLAARAPHRMTGYIVGMLATSVVITAITVTWKISVHCAVAAAAVTMVAFAYSPAVLLGYAPVALVAWSRVALRDHTTAQAVGGVLLGAVAAVMTCLAVP
jgi:hypothetical protein